jgi:hypothetical protein
MAQRQIAGITFYIVVSALFCASCTVVRHPKGVTDERKQKQEKVIADAYLFDAKINRHGKPTTLRLEMYAVGDTVYMYGRAYLGKGALHARLTADSLIAIFPTEKEFVADRVTEVISKGECEDRVIKSLTLSHLLANPPDKHSPLSEILSVNRDSDGRSPKKGKGKSRKKMYGVTDSACKWTLQLDYNTRSGRQHLVHILFDDGDGTRINASMREFKEMSPVPQSRVTLTIPSGYTRLSPR